MPELLKNGLRGMMVTIKAIGWGLEKGRTLYEYIFIPFLKKWWPKEITANRITITGLILVPAVILSALLKSHLDWPNSTRIIYPSQLD